MSRCGCASVASCLCAVVAGSSTIVAGSGSLADPWTVGLSLSTDTDQMAVISNGKLLVPGAGQRLGVSAGISMAQAVSVTTSTATGRYKKKGREVDAEIQVIASSAGTTSNDIALTLGVLPTPSVTGTPVGTFNYWKSSATAQWFSGTIYFISNGVYKLQAHGGTALATYLGTTPAFAVASGDRVDLLFSYESAS